MNPPVSKSPYSSKKRSITAAASLLRISTGHGPLNSAPAVFRISSGKPPAGSAMLMPMPSTAQLRPPLSKSIAASVKMPQTFLPFR